MSVQARQLFTDAKERAKPSLYGGAGRLPTRPKLRMLSSAPLEGLDGSEPDIPRTIHIGWRPRGHAQIICLLAQRSELDVAKLYRGRSVACLTGSMASPRCRSRPKVSSRWKS